VKGTLVKTITANTRFTDEFLLQKSLEELELLAEPFQKKGREQAAPAYAGLGAPTVRMTANAEPELEEPMGVPEPDYTAYSGFAN
jgi:glycerol kinase